MAFVLSPTDAALGRAVVNNTKIPSMVRDSIEVESGINDGIALPPIMICMTALTADAGTSILYILIFVSEVGREDNERMLSVIVLTVLSSIFMHGLAAVPLANFYGRYAARKLDATSCD